MKSRFVEHAKKNISFLSFSRFVRDEDKFEYKRRMKKKKKERKYFLVNGVSTERIEKEWNNSKYSFGYMEKL